MTPNEPDRRTAHADGGRSSWNPYGDGATREAMPPPASEGAPASVTGAQANEMLESLSSLTERVKDGVSKEAIVDTVKRFARTMQQKVAKLGGVAPPPECTRPSTTDIATSRFSMPARDSISNTLDGYRPDRDVVAPISVRPNAMELLWICGDCGEHYPRARECPEECSACGAPKQHFYAPIED